MTDHRLSESTVILTDLTTSADRNSTVDNTKHDDISNLSADDTVTPSAIHVDDEQLKLCSFNCKNVFTSAVLIGDIMKDVDFMFLHNITVLDDGSERIQCISLKTKTVPLLLVSVYFPTKGKNCVQEYTTVVDQLNEIIEKYQHTHNIIVGGDMNGDMR